MTDSSEAPSSSTVAPPPESYPYTPRWVILAFLVSFALNGYLLYAIYNQRDQINQSLDAANKRAGVLTAELDKTNASISDLKSDLQVTAQKLGLTEDELAHARAMSQSIRMEQAASAQKLREQIGQVQQQTSSQIGQVSSDLSNTKNDVAATQKDLADTKNKLTTAMGDLNVQSGLIASNHEEPCDGLPFDAKRDGAANSVESIEPIGSLPKFALRSESSLSSGRKRSMS